MKTLLTTVLAILAVLFGAHAPVIAQTQGVYKVARLKVDVTAGDAVTAKKEAHALAKRRALETVVRRITPFNSPERLSDISTKTIDDLLVGFVIQRERNSRTRYIATLDFSFSPDSIKRLLAEKGVALADQQAEPVSVMPVFIKGGKIDHTGRDPWRGAWNGLDLSNAIVPVKLARPSPSLTVDDVSTLLGGNLEAFIALRDKVKADKLVLAIAEPTADGTTLTTRLYGFDRIGSLGLTRHDQVEAADIKRTSNYSAAIALQVLEGRWKLVQSPSGAGGPGGQLQTIDLYVEFNGISEWKDLRSRLSKIPGVNALEQKSLSPRFAQVGLQYPGGAQSLADAVSNSGMSMSQSSNGAWVLRSF